MKLRYTPPAIADFDAIRAYIEARNPTAAWVVASFIRQSIRALEYFPHQGRATNRPSVRRLMVMNYPYVVYYRVAGDEVEILNIFHAKRNSLH